MNIAVYDDMRILRFWIPPSFKRRNDIQFFSMKNKALTAKSLAAADCVLISTNHVDYDWQWIVDNASLVIDTRNATAKVKRGKNKIVKA